MSEPIKHSVRRVSELLLLATLFILFWHLVITPSDYFIWFKTRVPLCALMDRAFPFATYVAALGIISGLLSFLPSKE